MQIRETIRTHLRRERELYSRGVKVLSLFFIDEVSKYRLYDGDSGSEMCIRDSYEVEEGCLSLSGTRRARRWESIKVRWQNEKFQERIKTCLLYPSRCV